MTTHLMGGDALVTQEYWSITGPAGEGTLMTFSPDPRKNPNAKDAVAKFKAKNIDPEAYTLYAYAAVQILKAAAEEEWPLGNDGVTCMRRSRRSGWWPTSSGRTQTSSSCARARTRW